MDDIKITINGLSVINVCIYNFNTNKEWKSNLIECIEKYYKNEKVKIRQIVIENYILNEIEKKILYLIKQETTEIIGLDSNYKLDDSDIHIPFEAQILIPYRARGVHKFREIQLNLFIEHIQKYMGNIHPSIKYKLVILEQNNDHPFNRGMLLNAGYLECEKSINQYIKYYIHHNCDLFPEIMNGLDYSYTCANEVRDLYGYHNGLGGICIINRNSFKKINGFPNNMWCWGNEDVVIKNRCEQNNIIIKRPSYNEFVKEETHERDSSFNRINQEKGRHDTPLLNGLTSCEYTCKIKVNNNNTIHYLIDFEF